MQRRLGVLVSAAVVLSLAGGGYVLHWAISDAHAPSFSSIGLGNAKDVDTGSVLSAVQPAPAAAKVPSASPSASPSAKPSTTPSKAKPTPKPTKTTPKSKPTAPPASSSIVDQLLAQINGLRGQHGLPPYTLLSGLEASAHKHNLAMMGSCGMSHQCPGEASLGSRISAEGVHWSACGENIGWSGPHPNTSSAIVAAAEGLTTSMYNETPPDDGHRLNLLSTQFHHIGIDVVRASDGKVWLTQDFSN